MMPITYGYGVGAARARFRRLPPNLAMLCPVAYENLEGWVPQGGTSGEIRDPGKPDPCGGNAAMRLIDSDAGNYRGLRKSYAMTADTRAYEFRCFVKKDPATTNVCEFQFRFGTLENRVSFHPATGAYDKTGAARARTVTVSEDISGWWTVKIDVTNNSNTNCDVYIWPALGPNLGDILTSGTGEITVYGVTFGLPTFLPFRHILYYGQSNALPRGTPIITPSALNIGSQQQYEGGIQPTYVQDTANWSGDDALVLAQSSVDTRLVIDPAQMNREHFAQTVAQILGETAPAIATLHSSHGVNGKAYTALKKGTVPYANMKVAQAALPTGRLTETVVVFVHGETDWNKATYGDDLAELETDLLGDFGHARLLITQMNNWTKVGSSTDIAPATLAQLAFVEAGEAEMICPTYHLYFEDGLHFEEYGQRMIGEKLAQVLQTPKGTWSPLRPISVTASATTITVQFTGRTGNLQLNVYDVDTNPNGVSDPGDYGFTLDDPGGAVITGVSIVANEVVIATNQAVTAGAVLGYANKASATGVDAGYLTGPRGCLSDSDPLVPSAELQTRRTGVELGNQSAQNAAAPLVNWCVAFEKTITIS